jgi:quercetin dioxygenase-like cupin family protein
MTSDRPTAVLSDLASELAIPDGGTLSRVLYKDDQVRVVGFAFDADEELTEHTAAVPIVIQVVSGRFRLTTEAGAHEIGPTSWVHLEASVPHSVYALEPSRLLLTLLRTA